MTKEQIEAHLEVHNSDILRILGKFQVAKAWIETNINKIVEIGCNISYSWGTVDFNNTTREQTLKIIKEFPGTWDKSTDSGVMNYSLRNSQPLLRIWNSELPNSCKLEEEEIVIPEHKEKRMKIVCNGGSEEKFE